MYPKDYKGLGDHEEDFSPFGTDSSKSSKTKKDTQAEVRRIRREQAVRSSGSVVWINISG